MFISASKASSLQSLYGFSDFSGTARVNFGATEDETRQKISEVPFDCGGSCKGNCLNCQTSLTQRLGRALKASALMISGKINVVYNAAVKACQPKED